MTMKALVVIFLLCLVASDALSFQKDLKQRHHAKAKAKPVGRATLHSQAHSSTVATHPIAEVQTQARVHAANTKTVAQKLHEQQHKKEGAKALTAAQVATLIRVKRAVATLELKAAQLLTMANKLKAKYSDLGDKFIQPEMQLPTSEESDQLPSEVAVEKMALSDMLPVYHNTTMEALADQAAAGAAGGAAGTTGGAGSNGSGGGASGGANSDDAAIQKLISEANALMKQVSSADAAAGGAGAAASSGATGGAAAAGADGAPSSSQSHQTSVHGATTPSATPAAAGAHAGS